jgi:hypothetical protein
MALNHKVLIKFYTIEKQDFVNFRVFDFVDILKSFLLESPGSEIKKGVVSKVENSPPRH